MGGFDVYCVICGSAVFNVVEGGHGYDPGIVTNASSSWTGDVRLISENPDARAASKYDWYSRIYKTSGYALILCQSLRNRPGGIRGCWLL